MLLGRLDGHTRQRAFHLILELVGHAHGVQVLAQCKAPAGQEAMRIGQFEMPDAGVVVVAQRQSFAVWPVAPCRFARRARQQTPVRHEN